MPLWRASPKREGVVCHKEEGMVMKRFPVLIGVLVLVLIGVVGADLSVEEHVVGQKVTVDDAGNYWVWDMAKFNDLNYSEQITAIDDLGDTYGGVTGNWHMATASEMAGLWSNSAAEISSSFGPSYVDHSWGSTDYYWYGRYDEPGWGYHLTGEIYNTSSLNKRDLGTSSTNDSSRLYYMGAWVTTGPGATVVPVPAAVILGASGLFSAAVGLRRRRKSSC